MKKSSWIHDWNVDPDSPLEWPELKIWDRSCELRGCQATPEWKRLLEEHQLLHPASEMVIVSSPVFKDREALKQEIEAAPPQALVVLDDRPGAATPTEVEVLCKFAPECGRNLAWAGGNRRGLAVANALTAIRSGVGTVLTTFFGIEDQISTDQLLVNLVLLGAIPRDGVELRKLAQEATQLFNFEVLPSYPVIGEDAFRTGTGVHAAAIIKAEKTGDVDLADQIYSGVPAHWFGYEQIIEVGPMAGASNILYWLKKNGYEATEEQVDRILERAKKSTRVLQDDELHEITTQKSDLTNF